MDAWGRPRTESREESRRAPEPVADKGVGVLTPIHPKLRRRNAPIEQSPMCSSATNANNEKANKDSKGIGRVRGK